MRREEIDICETGAAPSVILLKNMSNSGQIYGVAALFCTLIGRTALSATPDYCLPPEAPFPADPVLVAEYRPEILADYERYWTESSRYIRCLDEERARALAEVQSSLEDYQAVFDAKPAALAPIPSGD